MGQAQATPSETIVVTATRREQRVLDVPYNISAVSGAAIEDAHILDTPELVRSVPGVSVVDRGYRNNGVLNAVIMRGVNVDSNALGDYAVSTVSPVSTYVNDTPMFANFLLRDLERVEVLRGPQGTLYGSGSLGGTLRYITRTPQFGDFGGYARLGGAHVDGSEDSGWDADLTLNIPLGETLAVRLVGAVLDYPGVVDLPNAYVVDATGKPIAPGGILSDEQAYERIVDADTVDVWLGRIAVRWQPNEKFNAVLTHVRESDEIGGRRQPTVGQNGFGYVYQEYENGSLQREPASRDLNLTSLEATLDLGFATLTSSTSYYHHEGHSISENSGFYEHAGFWSPFFYFGFPRPLAVAQRDYVDRAFTQEVRLVSDDSGRFDYVLGLYYQDQNLYATQNSTIPGFTEWCLLSPACFYSAFVRDDQDFLYRRTEDFEDRAVFGELTFHVTETLDLTGGVRYFDNSDVNVTSQAVGLYSFYPPVETQTLEGSDSRALFKGNLSWRFAPDNMLYATVSEGYRRGGTNSVPLSGFWAEDPIWQFYDRDTVVNYEIGVKGRRSNGMMYDASVFYVDWKDPQYNTATTVGFFAVKNAESARSYGVELALDGRLGEQFHYNLGYSYTNAELTAPALSPFGVLLSRDGSQLPGIPEHAVNAAFDYTVPIGDNSLVFRLSGFYQSDTRNSLGLTPPDVAVARFNTPIDGFSLWNGSITYENGPWNAVLYVKNIFNEEGVTGEFTNAYMGNAVDPTITHYYGNGSKRFIALPRTVGVSLGVRF